MEQKTPSIVVSPQAGLELTQNSKRIPRKLFNAKPKLPASAGSTARDSFVQDTYACGLPLND